MIFCFAAVAIKLRFASSLFDLQQGVAVEHLAFLQRWIMRLARLDNLQPVLRLEEQQFISYAPLIEPRRPLPRLRFGSNSLTAFCQAMISSSNQTRRFGLM